jgi:hypothetical protein
METMNTSSNATNDVNATNVAIAESTTKLSVSTTPTTPPAGKARIAIGFLLKDTDANLIVASQTILAAMTGNAAYATPAPTLAEITTARNSYIAAVNAGKDSRIAKTVRSQQRKAFTGLLRNLAHYAQVTSGGDLPILLSSGFPAQKGRQRVGPLHVPANLRLKRGKVSGQLIARCNKLDQASAYDWQYATGATPTAWISVPSTFAAKNTFVGLVPGTQYMVRVRAVGTAGPSDWSSAATLMAV